MIRLNLPEPLLDLLPPPILISHLACPLIEVLISTHNPATKVDRRATSQSFTSRIIDLLTLQMSLGNGLIAPV